MNASSHLRRIFKIIAEEASTNPEFAAKLSQAIMEMKPSKPNKQSEHEERSSNRRSPAVLDPISMVREGEAELRSALEKLSLEQLRDIVAEYGMDSGKLVMKWVRADRVIDRIVALSLSRANKGHAFRKS